MKESSCASVFVCTGATHCGGGGGGTTSRVSWKSRANDVGIAIRSEDEKVLMRPPARPRTEEKE